jgi:hypothetical protein
MEIPETMKADRSTGRSHRLPDSLRSHCDEIARDIHDRSEAVRDEKILAARVRICSGYYDSENVLRVIADRLLTEGPDNLASS